MSMTHRERILATLRHERPDRVALDGWFRPEILRKLREALGVDDAEEALGLDWGGEGGCHVQWTEWEKRSDLEAKEGDWPGGGELFKWHDERTFEGPWGWRERIGRDGKYNEWLSGPLMDVDPDSKEAFERLDTIIPPHAFEPIEEAAARVKQTIASGRVATSGISLPFKIAWYLRGMENLFCDFLAYPDFAHALYDKLYAHFTEEVVRAAQAGTEIITVVGDIATQTGLMFSHEIFNDYTKSRLKRLVEKARAASPLDHLYFFYHCDGNMAEVLPDFVDEMGFDVINPIQPECMDPYAVKAEFGDRMTLHGTMSIVDLIPKGPIELIRRMVRERIDRLAYNGGFVLSSANVITYDTPVDHVLALYDEARKYSSDQWPAP